ncbi:MAG: hypothetical protein R3D98_13375 [Candidatus Krumholzibacteriia bacterium]
MNRVRLLGLIVLLGVMSLVSACTSSQRLNFLTVPGDEIAPEDRPDVAAYQQKYGRYDGVYLFYESTHEHSGNREKDFLDRAKWTYTRIIRERYLIFDPTNTELTSYRVYGRPDQIYVRLVAPDGSLRTYGVDDLKTERDEDGDLRFVLVFPDVVPGTLVDLGWEREWRFGYTPPPLEHDISLQFRYPCERATFTYAYPDWWTLDIKRIREGYDVPLEVTNDVQNKKITLHYEATDIPALEDEPFSPYFKEMADYLEFQVAKLDMAGGHLDRADTWQELADEFQRRVLKRGAKHTDDMVEKAAAITADCTTDLARARAILRYVRDEITVGAEHHDGDYKKVIAEGSGTIFEVVGLTQVLLEAAGIEAYMLFAHSADDGWFDPEYIALGQFRYPAVRAVIDGEDYVLFPYLKHLPLEHTPLWLQGQMALIIASGEEASSWDEGRVYDPGDAMIWRVPEGSRAGNVSRSRFDLDVAADGLLTVTETRILDGDAAFLMRNRFDDLDLQETDDAIKELLTYSDGEVTLERYELRHLEEPEQPLEIVMHYTIDNLVMVTPEEVILQTGGLLSPLSAVDVKLDPDRRQNPIRIAFEEEHDKEITVHYPESWQVSTGLEDVEFTNEFGSLQVGYAHEPGLVTITQTVKLHRASADETHYPQLLELIGERTRLHVPAIVFTVVGAT